MQTSHEHQLLAPRHNCGHDHGTIRPGTDRSNTPMSRSAILHGLHSSPRLAALTASLMRRCTALAHAHATILPPPSEASTPRLCCSARAAAQRQPPPQAGAAAHVAGISWLQLCCAASTGTRQFPGARVPITAPETEVSLQRWPRCCAASAAAPRWPAARAGAAAARRRGGACRLRAPAGGTAAPGTCRCCSSDAMRDVVLNL